MSDPSGLTICRDCGADDCWCTVPLAKNYPGSDPSRFHAVSDKLDLSETEPLTPEWQAFWARMDAEDEE